MSTITITIKPTDREGSTYSKEITYDDSTMCSDEVKQFMLELMVAVHPIMLKESTKLTPLELQAFAGRLIGYNPDAHLAEEDTRRKRIDATKVALKMLKGREIGEDIWSFEDANSSEASSANTTAAGDTAVPTHAAATEMPESATSNVQLGEQQCTNTPAKRKKDPPKKQTKRGKVSTMTPRERLSHAAQATRPVVTPDRLDSSLNNPDADTALPAVVVSSSPAATASTLFARLDKATRIYRHWVFRSRKCPTTDPYSRKPGLYALKYGCIYKSNWYFPLDHFPNNHQITLEQANSFYNDDANFNIYCHNHSRAKWNKDCLFATMPFNSIVCMIIPNASKQLQVCFGIISKDTCSIESQDELPPEFPVRHHCGVGETFLYHKVEWKCWSKLRQLPGNERCANGATMVKWLVECGPSCVLELQGENKHKALKHLQSQEFVDCCSTDFAVLLDEADRILAVEDEK